MEKPIVTTQSDSQLHFLDYWRIIRIRKTVILAVFLLVVITTTSVTYMLRKTFASTVRIRVEKDVTDVSNLYDRPNTTTYDPYFILTEFEVIQSKSTLFKVITNMVPPLNERWAKQFKRPDLTVSETFSLLKRLIDVRQYRNTALIEITVYNENKNEAAEIANEIADVYRKARLEQRQEASKRGIQKYQEKLAEQQTIVDKMQKDLDTLRIDLKISDYVTEAGAPTPTLEPETVRKLDNERIAANSTFSQMNTMLTQLTNMTRVQLIKALPAAIKNDQELTELLLRRNIAEQELTTLLASRSESHPDVKKVSDVLKTINDQIDKKVSGLMDGLKVQVASLKAQTDQAVMELDNAKRLDGENAQKYRPYYVLKRDLDTQQKLRDVMVMKIMTETIEKELPRGSIVEIIDLAEPGLKPVRPNIPLNIALGVVVGLVVGLGLAFFIEYLDTSVKTIDDVERSLQAPVIGVIPQNVGYLIHEGAESPHAEAYRVLRTNLLFARKDDRLNTITVISGGAAEGKSTTVFNLATVFAQNGHRVLIVDSDLRRPSLHKFVGVSNTTGLTNYLLRQKTLEEVVQTTKLATLDFLPSGKLPSSAMGILNSVRMTEFINEIKRRYDFVFFDSPPIMGVSDASVLASMVDMVLLVVQHRKYPQAMTVRAKQMIEKVGGRLMGVVLNNINISQDSYYYYYSGYYYDYYSKHDDAKPEAEIKPGGEPKPDDIAKPVVEEAKLDLKTKY